MLAVHRYRNSQKLGLIRQMTAVATRTGALSAGPVAWHTIDWYAVHRMVRRLQARLVKAVQVGRWGKVRALQHLLTHSFSGKALAVQRGTRSIANRETWHHRVPQGAFKRLELLEGKLSRAVLRGLSGSNLARLPGG